MQLIVPHMGDTARSTLASFSRGAVLSGHEGGIWCRFDAQSLILVHPERHGLLPFGLACPGGALPGRAETGTPVENDRGRGLLRCGGMVFDYGRAPAPRPVPPRVSPSRLAGRTEDAALRLARAYPVSFAAPWLRHWTALRDGAAPPPPFGSLWEQALWNAATTLLRTFLRAEEAGNAETPLPPMIGLGPGLTPLSDDILCSWMHTAHILAADPEGGNAARFARIAARSVPALCAGRTTPQSAACLRSAAAGEYFGMLGDLLAELDGAGAFPGAAAGRVMEIGHTSGSGFVLGMLLAVELLRIPAKGENPR